MRELLETRLGLLRKEFETGQAELEKVEQQRAYLREMMLQISGAIQVLEELLAQGASAEQNRTNSEAMQTAISQKDEVNV
jgi:hypothetical protein